MIYLCALNFTSSDTIVTLKNSPYRFCSFSVFRDRVLWSSSYLVDGFKHTDWKLHERPRWWRNSIGRQLSSPQIHQKIIWMLSNFHKTTSECWRRTPDTQKGSPFSSKWGRTKYKTLKRRETKELGTETHPGEGVMKKFPSSRKLSHRQVWG